MRPGRRGESGVVRRGPAWDAVIKVGGSLYGSPRLRSLLRALARGARKQRLLVVPGGGPFADAVRAAWRRHRLSERGAHRMALLGMDQYGLLLCDLEPRARPARTLAEAARAARAGRLPVLLVARLAASARDLPASWSVTSDSVAAWVAKRARAGRLVLIKSVDVGISAWTGVTHARTAGSLRALSAAGIVDAALPSLLPPRLDCWLVNGRRRRDLDALLRGAPGAAPPPRARAAPPHLRPRRLARPSAARRPY